MAGQINHIQNQPLGFLVIAVDGSKDAIDTALKELTDRVYKVELLGYEVE